MIVELEVRYFKVSVDYFHYYFPLNIYLCMYLVFMYLPLIIKENVLNYSNMDMYYCNNLMAIIGLIKKKIRKYLEYLP